MAFDGVKEYFEKHNLADRIKVFDISTATVKQAAEALGCNEANIAKTIAFNVNNEPILIVLAGDMKANNSKFKQTFKTKLKMLNYEETQDLIGHKVGGVCPFVIKPNVKVYLDISLKRFEFVYPAAGSANSGIKLSIDELAKYSNYIDWVDISTQINSSGI